jgi:hypothetical protein
LIRQVKAKAPITALLSILNILCKVGMLCYPLLHLDSYPKRINTQGNYGEQEPFYVIAKKLAARAVENDLTSVNDGVLCQPSLL